MGARSDWLSGEYRVWWLETASIRECRAREEEGHQGNDGSFVAMALAWLVEEGDWGMCAKGF